MYGKKKLEKQSMSQTIHLAMTIQTVQESSKSELSSRFLSTSKFGPPRKTSAQGHARLFAQGQGWLFVSINDCNGSKEYKCVNLNPTTCLGMQVAS